MENINIKLANAHQNQLRDFDVKREVSSIQEYVNFSKLDLEDNAVCLMCLRGYYDNFSKRTNTVFVFINHTGKAINEMHGVIRLHTESKDVQFARATIDFDEVFMGTLQHNDGLLVHLSIPTRGKNENIVFTTKNLEAQFTDIRVTYVE